jgi:CTP:molybdopterin cytidylyltransferase MocA
MDSAVAGSAAEITPQLASGEIALLDGGATPSASVLEALDHLPGALPLLVTTADHPLLSAATVDEFAIASAGAAVDVTVGLVSAAGVRAAFPGVRRTVLRLRGAEYCGCNLFAFLTPEARRAAAFWAEIEQHRKRPWRMLLPLGIPEVLRFALGRLNLDDLVALASRRMQVRVRAVLLSQPEAGFDVDKVEHLEAAEQYLRAQGEVGRGAGPRPV